MKSFSLRNHKSFWVPLLALFTLILLPVAEAVGIEFETEQQNIYNAAKAEGKAVLYTSADSPAVQRMFKVFQEKYPGIKPEVYRAGSGTVLEKLMSEHEAKIYSADVLLFHATMAWYDMKQKGMLLYYDSPVYNEYPKYAQDRGYTISARSMANFHGYNVNLVSQKLATSRQTFEDWVRLAEQKEYYGRFGSQDIATGGGIENIFAVFNKHGEEKAKSWYRRLFAAGLRLVEGGAAQINNIASGQEAFSFFIPSARFQEAFDKGAPVSFVVFKDGQAIFLSPMSIYAKSQHPNAAKLLFNWWTSREGQTLVVETTGSYSFLPGLPPPKGFPPLSELNLMQVPMDRWQEIGRKTEEIISFVDQLKRTAK
jgi:iron(III) transport system substrate-binding protein